jgi:uncharacterized protein (DUF1800 family)
MGEISERSAVRRLCDRLSFGPAPGELDAGFEATLARLLSTAADAATTPPPVLTPPQPTKAPKKKGADEDKTATDRAAKKAANKARAAQEAKLSGWWVDRMVASDRATERLTWFWHGHFATSNQKVRSAPLMLAQNQILRTHARGSFTDLAQALVVDAAMIRWLDGNDNRKGSPNENLAREFLELFTLGIGHYAEVDVFEGARALTGWAVRRTSAKAVFVAARHDSGEKTILGKSGEFGAKEFVDLALAKPESAEFVIGRLWFRLVSPTPPPPETVRRLVAAYGSGTSARC